MESLSEKVATVLNEAFAGCELGIDAAGPDARIAGWMVWTGFDGRSQLERQRQLRETLRQSLEARELHQVGMILTLTPDEVRDEEVA